MREAAKDGAFVVSDLLFLFDHIEELEAALLKSPVAAEVMKQLPNAMRLHTQRTDDLRAALAEACRLAHTFRARGYSQAELLEIGPSKELLELEKLLA